MNAFLAFGEDYVVWQYEKTGNPVYLHIKQTKKHRPAKKPTLPAMGVDVGSDSGQPEYEESYSILLLPEHVMLPFPSVELPKKVRLAADAIIIAVRKKQVAAWGAGKLVSAHAMDLKQIDDGAIVPCSGWKCAKCDKTEILWLNLTDGMILCGRKNLGGSGGNDHAGKRYKETG